MPVEFVKCGHEKDPKGSKTFHPKGKMDD